jgi:hypothetical protein
MASLAGWVFQATDGSPVGLMHYGPDQLWVLAGRITPGADKAVQAVSFRCLSLYL